HEYEMFTMHDNEDIKTMFTRFTNITNALQGLGKIYTNSEMVRKILRCLPRIWAKEIRRKVFKKNNTQKGESSKIEEIICYECNKPGHYKSDCPRLKKKEQGKKKKAMIATWEDSDDSNSDEEANEEVAQLALMAIEEEED
ncbi:LOW QUALITY PROTEIN: zf-CCHC domain-containing protein/UBN2 domain-containing protein, partial [Cephalotus follicularis]